MSSAAGRDAAGLDAEQLRRGRAARAPGRAPRPTSSPASSASTRWRRASSMAMTTTGTRIIGRPRALPAIGAVGRRHRRRPRRRRQRHHDRDRAGRQHVLQPRPHGAADVGALRARRGDRRVGDRRDAVAEGGAAEDGAEQRGGMHAGAGAGRIEQRPADQDRPEAGAGRRRDHGSRPGTRRRRRRRRAGRASARTHTSASTKPLAASTRAQCAGQQPRHDHQQHHRAGPCRARRSRRSGGDRAPAASRRPARRAAPARSRARRGRRAPPARRRRRGTRASGASAPATPPWNAGRWRSGVEQVREHRVRFEPEPRAPSPANEARIVAPRPDRLEPP